MTIAKHLFARSGLTSRSRGALPGSAGEPTAARRFSRRIAAAIDESRRM
jgi:hypothetical protein